MGPPGPSGCDERKSRESDGETGAYISEYSAESHS